MPQRLQECGCGAGSGPTQVGLVTGSQDWVTGIKPSFVCGGGVGWGALSHLSLGAETTGTVWTEAVGVEEREREEGGGVWGRGGSSQPAGHHNHFILQAFPVCHLTL